MHQTVEVQKLNSINTISKITLDLNYFNKINYAILEAGFWPELYKLFDEFKLVYHFIGLNVFKNKNICPLLIDLNKIDLAKKKIIWDEISFITTNSYESNFDKIYLFQNLIETKLNFDDFSLFLNSIISFNKKKIFRVYDPRVAMHLAIIYPKFISLSDFIDSWDLSVNGDWYKLDLSKEINSKITINDIELINRKIRYEINKYKVENSIQEINLIIKKVYGEFNV
ncbi:hypothetical protein D7V32_03655 [Acinetobacter tianfuensis]|uniref:DUF4123 domain-containing protein n=1 Tax=Acinetobacter tianfuensis TaxID=2419603 RepID=A0A3A8ER58_9GAMM|nr:hypothetical protein D7V32_03655 [Acinetobacter tianfuensis]